MDVFFTKEEEHGSLFIRGRKIVKNTHLTKRKLRRYFVLLIEVNFKDCKKYQKKWDKKKVQKREVIMR